MLARSIVIAIVAALAFSGSAHAASPFAAAQNAVTAGQKALGKKSAATLRKHLRRSRSAYEHRRWCEAISELGATVRLTQRVSGPQRKAAAAAVASRAVKLQRSIFLRHAVRHGSCGLPKPQVRVSPSLKPSRRTIAPLQDGRTRNIAAFAGKQGSTDFVSDEVVISASSRSTLDAFIARWHGKVLQRVDAPKGSPDTWLVRVNAAKADVAGLPADLRAVDPLSRGTTRVSSTAAAKLIAVAADAAAHGLVIAPNLLPRSTGVLDRSTSDGPATGTWSGDAFDQWYNKVDSDGSVTGEAVSYGSGIGEAWRTLEIGRRTANRVKLAVVDGGFSSAAGDFPVGSSGFTGAMNAMPCADDPCPWHGTNVASAAAAVVDNGVGVAGTGGQVAEVVAITQGSALGDNISAMNRAAATGARVINVSSGYGLDAVFGIFNGPYELATKAARDGGALVVVSAGNEGIDVDSLDCFIVCWEDLAIAPCENAGVICVGGIGSNGRRHPDSNWGYESCASAKCDVDVFAPYRVMVGPDPLDNTIHPAFGTSFSSPFVAGVAAMMLAVRPELGVEQLKTGLARLAHGSPDPLVSGIVNARDAVLYAIEPVPGVVGRFGFGPLIEATPSETSGPYGALNTYPMSVAAYDAFDTCCTYRWSSDVDGALGSSASIAPTFLTPGPRTITVKATTGDGREVSDTVAVSVANEPPNPAIAAPAANATVYRGQTIVVEGSASDPNEFAGLACSKLSWSHRATASTSFAPLVGCHLEVSFAESGPRVLRVKAEDAHGALSYANTTITVVDPPTHGPPLVTILSPQAGDVLDRDEAITLRATATDPDGTAVIHGTWSVVAGGKKTVIGDGNTRVWLPSDDVPDPGCHQGEARLVFSAVDADGTTTKHVDVKIAGVPC